MSIDRIVVTLAGLVAIVIVNLWSFLPKTRGPGSPRRLP